MTPQVRLLLTVLISGLVLLAFVILFGLGIIGTWTAPGPTPPTFDDTYLYVATGLAGLIGGLVAAGFNQTSPPAAQGVTNGNPAQIRPMSALGQLVLPQTSQQWQQLVASIYAVAYILLGAGAIATWVAKGTVTPDLVKNLASIALGLFLAIARSFLATGTTQQQ